MRSERISALTPALRAYVQSRLRGQDCEDVLQDILESLLRVKVKIHSEEEARRLAFTVARRRVADYWRQRVRVPVSIDTEEIIDGHVAEKKMQHLQLLRDLANIATELTDAERATLRSIQEYHGPLTANERKARQRLRSKLRAQIEERYGETVKDLFATEEEK